MRQDSTEDCAADRHRPFSFIHIGDLHLTDLLPGSDAVLLARQTRLYADLSAILKEISAIKTGQPDFVYLPGDIADDGETGQYSVLQQQLAATLFGAGQPPLHLIPGDHDRQWGMMGDFALFRSFVAEHVDIGRSVHNTMKRYPDGYDPIDQKVQQFYYSREFRGVHCIFLDCVSAGYGRKYLGPNFRLGAEQMCWLQKEVDTAKKNDRPCAVFMHCYPFDMADKDESTALSGLFWNAGVHFVEMGHTHYNELAPDGRTLYAAARSVGQNEDGPVGYAVGTIDRTVEQGVVTSWRFKQLQLGWPFVVITSPADHRLATAPLRLHSQQERITVRAMVMSDKPIAALHCDCSVDGGAWVPMSHKGGGLFEIDVPWRAGSKHVSVKVVDPTGPSKPSIDMDTIEPAALDFKPPSLPDTPGSDKQAIPSWLLRGIRGDQAGPNRSGYRW